MSDRYEYTTVCVLDRVGDRYYIYDCDHHAGGGEYKSVITVNEAQYQVCGYPMENKVEEIGEKLPFLKIEDLQSYFTDTKTDAIRQVMAKAQVDDLSFAQIVMIVQYAIGDVIHEAECIHVTADGVERIWYDCLRDWVGDDIASMQDHIVDEAWYSYHHKLGDLLDDE